jgi:hypothetical protein
MHHVEQLVCFTVGVGKCSNLCWVVLEKVAKVLRCAVADNRQGVAGVSELLCSLREVSSLLTAEQSAKVADEDQDGRTRLPE